MVEIVHWNPVRREVPGWRGLLTPRRPVNNFGDLLGPVIVRELVARAGGDPAAGADARLVTVGSVLAMARAGDVVWGSGVNGKLVDREHALSGVDVRAVRGPRTRDFARRRGAEVPEVYGDPGLLVGHLWTRSALAGDRPRTDHLVVPNLHDLAAADRAHPTLSPRSPLDVCLGSIAASGFVVASSLHGVVVADALGVPARFVRSAVEPELKYRDYLEGTGRADVEIAETVEDALRLGPHPPPAWDPGPLLRAFPAELWGLRTVVEAARPVSGGPLAHGPTTGGNVAERRAWSGQRTGEGPGAGQGAGLHGLS